MLEVGSVIAGKLRIDRILGQGGMGIVAAATHLQLEQRVAVKVMRDQLAHDPSTVERFMREARAAARLRSDNVCRVTDVGQLASGAPYIVMELLEGTDLAGLVARGALPIATAVDYVMQACIAIAEAHASGIVHRDLKPANLFLTKHLGGAPLIKVLDFGIAKAPTKAEAALTQTESMMGSPGYMSPEQLRSARDVDARTDVWALGVILYQLVSARLPFPAGSVTELAVKVAMDPPDPLDVAPPFVAIVMRCLEKTPAARYPDVASLAAALAPFGTESARRSLAVIEQVAPRPDSNAFASTMAALPSGSAHVDPMARTAASIVPGHEPSTTLRGATGYAQIPATTQARKRPQLWLAAGALVLAGGAVGVVALMRPTPAPPTVRPASAVTQPPSPPQSGAADPARLADLGARFDKAIERTRCSEATTLGHELLTLGAGASATEQVSACLQRRMTAVADPTAEGATEIVLAMAQELFEAKQFSQARPLVDRLLISGEDSQPARLLGAKIACQEAMPGIARRYVAQMSAGTLRDEAVAFCKTLDIDVAMKATVVATTGKSPKAPAPKPPSSSPRKTPSADSSGWQNEAGMAMMQGQYKTALAIAQEALAANPGDQHAMYIITGAYCFLEDAPSARKWARKLDAERLAKVKRFGCDRVDIDLDAK